MGLFNLFNTRNTKIGDFIILKADGGLGSVILQYALGQNIKRHTGMNVKYDISWFDGEALDCDKKKKYKFLIKELFPDIDFEIASKDEIKYYKKHFYYKNNQTWKYNDLLFSNKEPKYFDGYYSHYKYWYDLEDLLQKELDFSLWKPDEANLKMKKEIQSSEYSVGIHIRRGDFVRLGWCSLSDEYYLNAVRYIQNSVKKQVKLFFFSNDTDYVKTNILKKVSGVDYSIVDINDHYRGHFDMYLLSLCNSVIIANSTFSICSALLNKNADKIIASPDSWGYNAKPNNKNVFYDGMEESIRNPYWVIFNHITGDRV